MGFLNFLFGKEKAVLDSLISSESNEIKLLNRKELVVAIENMLRDEKDAVLLLSPYVKLSKDIVSILKNSEAKIRLIVRKPFEKDKAEAEKNLAEIKQKLPKLTHCINEAENLHAKIYMTTKKIVVASMNLHEYSENNNFEVGFVLDNNLENKICKKLYGEVYHLFDKNRINVKFLERLYYTKRCSICKQHIEDQHVFCYDCNEKQKKGNK